jgi:hypothetical protein
MTQAKSGSEALLEALAPEIRKRMGTAPGEYFGMDEVFDAVRAQLAERRRRVE